jgi:hypothetical protein
MNSAEFVVSFEASDVTVTLKQKDACDYSWQDYELEIQTFWQ